MLFLPSIESTSVKKLIGPLITSPNDILEQAVRELSLKSPDSKVLGDDAQSTLGNHPQSRDSTSQLRLMIILKRIE